MRHWSPPHIYWIIKHKWTRGHAQEKEILFPVFQILIRWAGVVLNQWIGANGPTRQCA